MSLPSNWKNIHTSNTSTLIMGILNVTTDSFSDGGQFIDRDIAVNHALEMEKSGADIIDIGGESTRPGAEPVTMEEELDRVISIIEGIRSNSNVCISIDTYKADVADKALSAGADMVNDISGLQFDERMVNVVRAANVPVIIMHIKGTPRNMQQDPHYENLMEEIVAYFQERVEFCHEHGIKNENIILDPGIGFGKRLQDNFELLRELKQISNLGFPVLSGPSRKSFIGLTLDLPVDERVEGTAAAVTASILNNANIVRVHDVKEMKRVAIITDTIRGLA
ncbi:MAG: dihydropteroate synthase [Candidatus Marinimicrobia bacterium]|nr:dihydropteroate synthase [Candidatus Neomarinimicrobiota bacterium]MDP6499632.1 dihydropteroate synthase [Candidatus Neomarinimicrobiota bacterium]MDP6725773.1 dihydropteroate synthase [Candidatus Neomarinimicrobiota bacterium]